ncbi:hypothetical protein Tco_0786332, partial [Tanacetum coccineum]
KAGHVRVLHVPSRFQYADIFTKGLPSALFEDFRSSLSFFDKDQLFDFKNSMRENGDMDIGTIHADLYVTTNSLYLRWIPSIQCSENWKAVTFPSFCDFVAQTAEEY